MDHISHVVHRVDDARFLLPRLSLAAGVVHAALVGDHMSQYTLFGYAFVAMAAFQIIWTLAASKGISRGLLVLGAVGNLAFLAAWALSRTTGLPFGHEVWEREAVGFVDFLAVVPEASFVGIAIAQLRR